MEPFDCPKSSPSFWLSSSEHNSSERKNVLREELLDPSFLIRLTPVFLFLFLCFLSYWRMRWSKFGRKISLIPGPPVFPFIGSGYVFFGKPHKLKDRLRAVVQQYGRRVRIWKMDIPYVLLLDPKDIEVILTSSKHIDKSRDYQPMEWMNGKGLITSGGDMWREDRKILNPSFKYQRFDDFLESFNRHARILHSILSEKFPSGTEMINIHPEICRATMDTVFESVLGTSLNIQKNASEKGSLGHELYDCVRNVQYVLRTQALKPWLHLPVIKYLTGLSKLQAECKRTCTNAMLRVIHERKAKLGGKLGNAFLDPLIPTRSDQNLVDHAFTVFLAGFETNATGMNFALFLLALHPDHQAKVKAEVELVLGTEKRDRDLTLKDISELRHLDQCILEAMRIFPPAPLIARSLKEDVSLHDGTVLPAGSDFVVFTHLLHSDPELWAPNPGEFDPSRFSPERIKERHGHAFVPFSKGPRSCIGQKYAMTQMKVMLAHILRDFWVTTNIKELKDVEIIYGVIAETSREIKLSLVPHSQNNNKEVGIISGQ